MTTMKVSWVERESFRYPMQFFNPMSFVLPDIKEAFRWCEFFVLSDPQIHAVFQKVAYYPITDIVVMSKDAELKKLIEDVFERLNINNLLVTANMHLLTYGNVFATVEQPFNRILKCRHCNSSFPFESVDKIGLTSNYGFTGECPKCKSTVVFDFTDQYITNLHKFKIVLWNPAYIDIEPSFATAEPIYSFNVKSYIEQRLQNFLYTSLLSIDPTIQDTKFLESKYYLKDIPGIFLKALAKKQNAVFNNALLLHVTMPNVPGWQSAWGRPPLLPVLRDLYFYYLVRKALEVFIRERLFLYRFVFPRSTTGDPALEINLARYKSELTRILRDMEYDPNIIGFLPLPFEQMHIGGEALQIFEPMMNMMTTLERRIVNGLGFPLEFLSGTLSWSGSSVTLRMMENLFINQRYMLSNILRFVIKIVASIAQFNPNDVSADFSPMRMADDIARQRLFFELNRAQIIPDSILLEHLGLDPDDVASEHVSDEKRKRKYMEEMATTRAAQQAKMLSMEAQLNPIAQFRAQEIARRLGRSPNEYYKFPENVINMLYYFLQLSEDEQRALLNEMRISSPGMYVLFRDVVRDLSRKQQPAAQAQAPAQGEAQETAPEAKDALPEQKPPRRRGEKKTI